MSHRRLIVPAALVCLSACRLDTAPADPGSPVPDAAFDGAPDVVPDGAPDAADGHSDGSDGAPKHRCAVVATTEFRADGGVTVIDVDTLETAVDVTAIHSDAVVRVVDGRVFVVNREGGDSLQELDPTNGYATLSQRSVGRGSNPWSLTMLDDGTAWVPLYNDGALLHVDTLSADDGAFKVGDPVPLPAWTDADGRVEPMDAVLRDGVLYVLVQGLGDYPNCTGDSRGWIHAMDPTTLAPVAAFGGESSLELAACNPTSLAARADGTVAVGLSGDFRARGRTEDDGGIEFIDLAAGTSSGLMVDESALGDRDIIAIADAGAHLWVALAGDDFDSEVRSLAYDGTLGPAVWTADTGGVFDLDVAYGRLWIVDRSVADPGVVVLDAADGSWIAGPIDTGFPPFDLDFVAQDTPCLPVFR